MTDLDVGPIDYLVLEFPEAKFTGEGFRELLDLVDRGVIRILDMRVVKREVDGTFSAAALADLDHDGTLDLAVFEGIESGLLDDEDLAAAAQMIQPGSAAGMLVSSMRRAGADVVSSGRIPAGDVITKLDALDALDA